MEIKVVVGLIGILISIILGTVWHQAKQQEIKALAPQTLAPKTLAPQNSSTKQPSDGIPEFDKGPHRWTITCGNGQTYVPDDVEGADALIWFTGQYAKFYVNHNEIDCSNYTIEDKR
jgi:hypothetical protein